jgi:hypothetical protein
MPEKICNDKCYYGLMESKFSEDAKKGVEVKRGQTTFDGALSFLTGIDCYKDVSSTKGGWTKTFYTCANITVITAPFKGDHAMQAVKNDDKISFEMKNELGAAILTASWNEADESLSIFDNVGSNQLLRGKKDPIISDWRAGMALLAGVGVKDVDVEYCSPDCDTREDEITGVSHVIECYDDCRDIDSPDTQNGAN